MAEDATASEEEADEVATDEEKNEEATGDADAAGDETAAAGPAPVLRITGLHIAGYRSLRRLDWPDDGLGWGGKIPDIVLVGGANGSGKCGRGARARERQVAGQPVRGATHRADTAAVSGRVGEILA